MSKYDQQQLLASTHPFDLLDDRVIIQLSTQMDIAYYPVGTTLISPSIGSDALYIIIKGSVYEHLEDELHNVYNEGDSFDANALIYSDTKSKFVVQEDLICYLLDKEIFLNLIQDHESFKSYYLQDFISKHQLLKKHQQQNRLTPFMMAKVSDIFLHEACIVEPQCSIRSALVEMQALHSSAILTEMPQGLGIITDADLRAKVLLEGISQDAAVETIAKSPVVTIDVEAFLFNALLLFTKHGIKRLVVLKEKKVVGILEQIDLLSHFANHSYLIAMQVAKARSIDELSNIQKEQHFLVQSMQAKGVKVRYISKLVSELNEKVYSKVYELSVPQEYRSQAALIVMGSEGRHEQTLRTDQDNALIISNEADVSLFEPFMIQFSKHLETLGFPLCKGAVMVNNAEWRGSVKRFEARIDHWVESYDEASLQKLAIFLDAHCVSGDCTLLDETKHFLYRCFTAREDILAQMAKSALSFETPLTLFSNFITERSSNSSAIDLKKGGIFAIVHGIRVLALEHGIHDTNTIERIKALNNQNIFDKQFATELIEAYDTLLGIRLNARLKKPENLEDANFINPKDLDKFERDLLKDSFKVLNTFKKYLNYHYHLNMVT